jgi:hypothetical protein
MAYTTVDDGSEYFQAITYTGNSNTSHAVTNTGNSNLQPDWIWVKIRTGQNDDHVLVDSSRGNLKRLKSNQNYAEPSDRAEIKSFDSNGFTLGTDDGSSNYNNFTYVAWQWRANGGTTSSNTDGSITTTVQANTTAGFSIVTYTGNATNGATIGHGLGAVPQVIIKKNRVDSGTEWNVYHHSIGNTKSLFLNTTEAATTESAYNNTSPTSSIQTINGSGANNGDGDNMIAYFFTPIKGYSKFGSYTGNGNADGAFVYTGFKPAWLMIHRTDSSGENWQMFDNKRDGFNNGSSSNKMLKANVSETEDTNSTGFLDLLSNGFKIRESAARHNASGATYVYLAFAEHPFVSSEGVPVTAR